MPKGFPKALQNKMIVVSVPAHQEWSEEAYRSPITSNAKKLSPGGEL
jgi:hypothetical protein